MTRRGVTEGALRIKGAFASDADGAAPGGYLTRCTTSSMPSRRRRCPARVRSPRCGATSGCRESTRTSRPRLPVRRPRDMRNPMDDCRRLPGMLLTRVTLAYRNRCFRLRELAARTPHERGDFAQNALTQPGADCSKAVAPGPCRGKTRGHDRDIAARARHPVGTVYRRFARKTGPARAVAGDRIAESSEPAATRWTNRPLGRVLPLARFLVETQTRDPVFVHAVGEATRGTRRATGECRATRVRVRCGGDRPRSAHRRDARRCRPRWRAFGSSAASRPPPIPVPRTARRAPADQERTPGSRSSSTGLRTDTHAD